MSLYVGRLSPHIRPEELIRVFRKFGRCDLQLKDGYGFVVYKVITDAERALRALRGKNICGEQLFLNWSNRQPRPYQRSPRPNRIYEPYGGRNFKENGVDIGVSQGRRELCRSDPIVPSYNHGRRHDYIHDKETSHACDDVDDIGLERVPSSREGLLDEGHASEHNPVENDRWGVPVNDALTGHLVENSSEFDRYEPYHGYNRRDEKENSRMTSSYVSPGHGGSPVKRRREHSYDKTDKKFDGLKPQPACYNCGQVGHIKRNCPEGDERRDKYSKFNHRRDEINFRDRAAGRQKMLRSDSGGRGDASRGASIFRHHRHDEKGSHSGRSRRLVRRRESFPERREKRRHKLRAQSQAKKRRKQEHGTRRNIVKKRRTRRSDTSSLSSDSSKNSSQSHSLSSRSHSRTTSCSTSRSSSRSRSASSRSRSVSVSSSSKSKSSLLRPRSSSGSHKSPRLSVSSGKKPSSSPHNLHQNVYPSTSKKGKLEHLLHENSELKDEKAFVKVKAENEVYEQYLGHNADDAPHYPSMGGDKETHYAMNLPKAVGTTEKSKLEGALMTKPKTQNSVGCMGGNPLKITTQEMIMALKHYGLQAPGEDGSERSVEEYFGAARLWPWEMIYYRRLKKGPISTENYARRLEQNKEFGIMDKYVRSSSGWGECEQNDNVKAMQKKQV